MKGFNCAAFFFKRLDFSDDVICHKPEVSFSRKAGKTELLWKALKFCVNFSQI